MRKTTLLIAMLFASVAMMAQTVNLTVNVDMKPAIDSADYGFTQTSGTVIITGSLTGWEEPGKDGSVEMTNSEGTIYTATVEVDANSEVEFKIFVVDNDKTPSWDYGEWTGDPNRKLAIGANDVVTNIVWADTTTVDVPEAQVVENVAVYPNPFTSELTIDNLEGVKEIRIANMLGQNVMVIRDMESRKVVSTSRLENGIYLISIVDENNNVRTERIVKQ